MVEIDRQEFERHLGILCAGFNVPVGERAEAYWRGFRSFPLSVFARVVDAALSSGELEKMPTVAALHGLRRRQARGPAVVREQTRAELLTEAAMGRFRLSDWQAHNPASAWSYLYRNPAGADCECIGLDIPPDPADPVRYPARTMRWSEYVDAADSE